MDTDWDNFNSCVLIETISDDGSKWYSGIAVKRDLILTSSDLLERAFLKIYIHTLIGKNQKKFKVENLDRHEKLNLVRIKVKENLPANTNIYPILKDAKNVRGRFVRLGFTKDLKNKSLVLNQQIQNIDERNETIIFDQTDLRRNEIGSGLFLINGGQINLISIASRNGLSKKSKIGTYPILCNTKDWINSHFKY